MPFKKGRGAVPALFEKLFYVYTARKRRLLSETLFAQYFSAERLLHRLLPAGDDADAGLGDAPEVPAAEGADALVRRGCGGVGGGRVDGSGRQGQPKQQEHEDGKQVPGPRARGQGGNCFFPIRLVAINIGGKISKKPLQGSGEGEGKRH